MPRRDDRLTDETLRRSLSDWIVEACSRTRALADQLDDDQLLGPRLDSVNPPLWELGHIAWFYERWVIRHAAGEAPVLETSGRMHNSMAVDHDIRWDAHLPDRQSAYDYYSTVCERVTGLLDSRADDPRLAYHAFYALLHEDMHYEAFAYSRQTLGWPAPPWAGEAAAEAGESMASEPGDVALAGGRFRLGAERDAPFVFDNEKWAHEVEIEPFAIDRVPVTETDFARFVDEGGYGERRLWSDRGWTWRDREDASHPVYWRSDGAGGWECRVFDRWRPIDPELPVVHVTFHEAEAYCRWAERRLPTEAEWELAASSNGGGQGASATRPLPWTRAPSTDAGATGRERDADRHRRANVDGAMGGTAPVSAFAAGDSADGVRQLLGNVWEWTASRFEPYPGFVADPYADYSEPWFGDRQVLRGGCWATRARMLRNTLRNFFPPDRRDIFAGFRTCAPRV